MQVIRGSRTDHSIDHIYTIIAEGQSRHRPPQEGQEVFMLQSLPATRHRPPPREGQEVLLVHVIAPPREGQEVFLLHVISTPGRTGSRRQQGGLRGGTDNNLKAAILG